jgi:Ankyrin repeats (3 copies)
MAQRGGSDGRPSYNSVQYAEVEYAQGDEEYSGDEAHGDNPEGEFFEDQGTLLSHEETQTYEDSSTIPDILLLNNLCANAAAPRTSTEEAKLEADESWEPVREWLRTHTADEVRQAAEQRGESSMTALHFACRNQPPMDVINVFLSIAVEVVQWPDSFGWLPIHYACACGAETGVVKGLAEAFPESKTTVDRQGRTPLHFALGNQNPDHLAPPTMVAILSSTGAASYADDNGMLVSDCKCCIFVATEPLHFHGLANNRYFSKS